MSAEAVGWVFRHSPYKGVGLLIHLAIAEVVNDLHGNEFWMTPRRLAEKVRCDRSTVIRWRDQMTKDKYLDCKEPGSGADHRAARYVFLFKEEAPVHFDSRKALGQASGGRPPNNPSAENDRVSENPGASDPETLVHLAENPGARVHHIEATEQEQEKTSHIEPKTLAASPSANGSERTHRPRDELFEALVAACGLSLEELTRSARGAANSALKQLRDVNATPDEIEVRAGRFRSMYPGLMLTPSALAKHWPALNEIAVGPLPNGRRRSNTDAIREGFRRMGVTLE